MIPLIFSNLQSFIDSYYCFELLLPRFPCAQGLPLGVHRSGAGLAPESDLTHRALAEGSQASVQSRRGETAEEKKTRKGAVKEGNVRTCPCALHIAKPYLPIALNMFLPFS